MFSKLNLALKKFIFFTNSKIKMDYHYTTYKPVMVVNYQALKQLILNGNSIKIKLTTIDQVTILMQLQCEITGIPFTRAPSQSPHAFFNRYTWLLIENKPTMFKWFINKEFYHEWKGISCELDLTSDFSNMSTFINVPGYNTRIKVPHPYTIYTV